MVAYVYHKWIGAVLVNIIKLLKPTCIVRQEIVP